jgi:hypothetical protein
MPTVYSPSEVPYVYAECALGIIERSLSGDIRAHCATFVPCQTDSKEMSLASLHLYNLCHEYNLY